MLAKELRHIRLQSFRNAQWDKSDYKYLYSYLIRLFEDQLHFAQANNPLWCARLATLGTLNFESGSLAKIPLLTKDELRLRDPLDFAAKKNFPFYMVRQSGGTTGNPVPLYWTRADWNAAVRAVCRFLEPLADIKPLVAWNGYNQSHAGGPSFDDAIRELGGMVVPRHFKSDDQAAIEEIERFKAQVLILPAKSGTEKGGSLEDLLICDAGFLSRLNIKALMVSSTGLDPDLLEEARAQGVQHIINLYGSTEAFPSAISCEANPLMFHLCQGPNLTEVVGTDGDSVKNGERGLVVISRVGSESEAGIFPAGGTQLIRFIVGDEATYITDPCSCGRSSPRIGDVRRIINIQDKITGGCQKWE
ncbi:MAG: hypothetical protein AB7T49_08200 [Oligoflexales bacterium]